MVEKELRDEALSLVKKLEDVFSISLDGTSSSIDQVDQILGLLREKFLVDKNEEEAKTFAFALATYIVTLLDNELGEGDWETDDLELGEETYPYHANNQTTAFPFAWCMRRIIDGENEDVSYKFRVFLEQ
jgi:hypothetical protein